MPALKPPYLACSACRSLSSSTPQPPSARASPWSCLRGSEVRWIATAHAVPPAPQKRRPRPRASRMALCQPRRAPSPGGSARARTVAVLAPRSWAPRSDSGWRRLRACPSLAALRLQALASPWPVRAPGSAGDEEAKEDWCSRDGHVMNCEPGPAPTRPTPACASTPDRLPAVVGTGPRRNHSAARFAFCNRALRCPEPGVNRICTVGSSHVSVTCLQNQPPG